VIRFGIDEVAAVDRGELFAEQVKESDYWVC
jgi:hypothetical protein